MTCTFVTCSIRLPWLGGLTHQLFARRVVEVRLRLQACGTTLFHAHHALSFVGTVQHPSISRLCSIAFLTVRNTLVELLTDQCSICHPGSEVDEFRTKSQPNVVAAWSLEGYFICLVYLHVHATLFIVTFACQCMLLPLRLLHGWHAQTDCCWWKRIIMIGS